MREYLTAELEAEAREWIEEYNIYTSKTFEFERDYLLMLRLTPNLCAKELTFGDNILLQDIVYYGKNGSKVADLDLLIEEPQLKEYSDLFVRMLGSVYENLQYDIKNVIVIDDYACQPFSFNVLSPDSWVFNHGSQIKQKEKLNKIIQNEEIKKMLDTQKICRKYFDNILLIIKPNKLRYWIQSTAIRNADQALADLIRIKQSY